MKYDGMPLLAHAIVQQQRARANAGTSLGLTIMCWETQGDTGEQQRCKASETPEIRRVRRLENRAS